MTTIAMIGPLEVRYYGVLLAIGFLASYFILKRLAKLENIKQEVIEEYLLWLAVRALGGARLFHVFFYNWAYFSQNLLQILFIWQGGLASHGALLGGAIASYVFAKKKNISLYTLTDLVVILVGLISAAIRVGNFTNTELVGKITNASWAVTFPGQQGARHPVQLYQAAVNFVIFLSMTVLYYQKKWQPGILTWTFLGLYSIGRFITEFYKDLPPYYLFNLNLAQLLSVFLFFTAAVMLSKIIKKRNV